MLFFVSAALLSTTSPAHAAGEPPVAEAGLGLIAYVDDTVILDGSGSSDAEGDTLHFDWTQVGGPPVELARADSPQPQFQVASSGTFRFELVVSDDLSASAPDAVEVVVPFRAIEGVETGCSTATGAASIVGIALAFAGLVRRRHGSR